MYDSQSGEGENLSNTIESNKNLSLPKHKDTYILTWIYDYMVHVYLPMGHDFRDKVLMLN